MSWNEEYREDEIVADVTKPLKKIWDNLMPKSYPYIVSFKTNRASEVKQRREMGPYHMTEHFIDYDCDVKIDSTPMKKYGWDGGKITKELVDKAYGELYFTELRAKMVELMRYAGLKFSTFDAGGRLHAETND